MIPYGRQWIDDEDIAAVTAVLKGDWLTQGPHVEEFEERLVEITGARYAIAFANGTAALHAAMAAAGIGAGDIAVTSALTFVASANCARYVGADVALVDIDPDTLLFDPDRLPSRYDALVAVHYAGLASDLASLKRPRVVIEDAAHALGARTTSGPVGNCAHSDMCMFSFHPVKHVTTGEGGAITTNSGRLADKLRRFRSHGTVRKPSEGGWYYEAESLGFNYRITDIQAALGTSQLNKLDRFVDRRNQLADQYRTLLADLPIELPPPAPNGARHAYHLFPIRVEGRRRVYDEMRSRGVGVQVHYVPVYKHPLYAHLGGASQFPETERAYARLLSLPLFPGLTDDEQRAVVDVMRDLL